MELKNIAYKILVIFMIMISLLFFKSPSISQASRIKVKEGEFYYSGTQDANYVVEASWIEKLANTLAEIADYIIGLMTMGVRGVVIGWVELLEIILTALLTTEKNFIDVFSDALLDFGNPNAYADTVVTLEKIIFNKVDILDANLLKPDSEN